ncbi:hypothetical protein VTI74DRAFT_5673 [Chaetomium olivicolor]
MSLATGSCPLPRLRCVYPLSVSQFQGQGADRGGIVRCKLRNFPRKAAEDAALANCIALKSRLSSASGQLPLRRDAPRTAPPRPSMQRSSHLTSPAARDSPGKSSIASQAITITITLPSKSGRDPNAGSAFPQRLSLTQQRCPSTFGCAVRPSSPTFAGSAPPRGPE